MKPKTLLLTLTLGLAAAVVCLAGDTKVEQALRDADDAWSKAAASKDLEKTVSYYSADAIVLPPNAPIATTKEAIKKLWGDLLASPGLVISWKATKVEVAKSGDLGFVSGTYEIRFGKSRLMGTGNAEPTPGTPICPHPRPTRQNSCRGGRVGRKK
jgi:ketosteroid isomerase-like protein